MHAGGHGWRLGHKPGLDGLRGIAVAMVMAGHAGFGPQSIHAIGVEVFFVLSGFLITTLLVTEWVDTGQIRLGQFYLRRARRLLPALFMLLVAVAALVWLGEVDQIGSNRGIIAGATYSSNIVKMHNENLGVLGHLWSLAIEEHFYLVWPAVVFVTLKLSRRVSVALGVALVLLVGSMMSRVALVDSANYARLFHGDDTRAAGLLVGCIAALIVHSRGIPTPRPAVAVVVGVAAAAVLWHVSGEQFTTGAGLWLLWLPAGSLASLAAIMLACTQNPVQRVLSTRWLVRLGVISYGVYLYHTPIFVLTLAGDSGYYGVTAVSIVATIAVASASYRWVEQPIRKQGFRAYINRSGQPVRAGEVTEVVERHVPSEDRDMSDPTHPVRVRG